MKNTFDNRKDGCRNVIKESPGLGTSAGRSVYFVRHGVTEWNKASRYQGSSDVPLSEEGIEQANRVAARMSQIKPERIISSPMLRAAETAKIIRQETGGPDIEFWDEIAEVCFGDWEGLTVREIKEKSGAETFAAWRAAQLSTTVPGGEKAEEVLERSKKAADRIAAMSEDNIVVVGHGALFRALLPFFIGISINNVFWKMRMDNCSITLADISVSGVRTLVRLNDTLHISAAAEIVRKIPLR